MIRLIIFAIVMLALSGICNGQGKTTFGAGRSQDTSLTQAQLKLPAYASPDSNVLITTPNGTVKKVPLYAAGFGLDLSANQFSVDTSEIATQYDVSVKEAVLTFSTGLTRSTNTITNNLSTGTSGGQSVIGGTASGNNLTLSSTSHATKGKILFGTSAYDEVNNRLGVGTTSPSVQIQATSADIGAAANIFARNTNASGEAKIRVSNDQGTLGFGAYMVAYGSASITHPNDGGIVSFNNLVLGASGSIASGGTSSIIFKSSGLDANQEKMRLISNGNLGVGLSIPTAVIHTKAGAATAGRAPLKFTSGINLSIAEAGAMEYDGTSLFFSPSTTRLRAALTDNTIPSNGQLPIGNGTNYTNAALTEGTGIAITNGAGSITVAMNGRLSFQTSAAGTLSLGSAVINTFSGTTSTWSLPAIASGNNGAFYIIKNRGSGAITLDVTGGAATIYDNAAVTSITINPGESYTIFSDGVYWNTKP